MSAAESKRDTDNKLVSIFGKMRVEEKTGITRIESQIVDSSDTKRRLIQEIMTYGDEKVINYIDENSQAFMDLVDELGDEAGAKWDDLIVRFEWHFELEKIMQNEYQYTDEVMQAIEKAKNEPHLKYQFNEDMVNDWQIHLGEEKTGDDEDLYANIEKFIAKNLHVY